MTAMRPTGHHSRVSISDARGDSIPAGQARVRLKLGAMAYTYAQIGITANIDLAGAALDVLCSASVHYWECVTGRKFDREINQSAADDLRVAALAYVNSRHGVDATIEMARAGTAGLCEEAIAFCDSHFR